MSGGTIPTGRPSGDGWVDCRCGERHWGRHGAAGLLLSDGEGRLVLQHRATWSHHGGTWGIPGGARLAGETPLQAAQREAAEEAGIDAQAVRPHAAHVLSHPDWSYTTVLATAAPGLAVKPTDAESIDVRWHTQERLADLPLLGAFAAAWPSLESMLSTDAMLVVDVANLVGSRPDGWWKDRAGATARLLHRLPAMARQGLPASLLDLPGAHWWPRVVAVTEGRGNDAPDVAGVERTRAPGSGDDAIGEEVGDAVGTGAVVTVVTADRRLRSEVQALGARTIGPGALWSLLDRSGD